MNLVIDIGNTSVKCGVFRGDKKIHTFLLGKKISLQKTRELFSRHPIKHSCISTVRRKDKNYSALVYFLKKKTYFLELNSKTKIPLKNLYQSPETLGTDRLASAVGANYLYHGKNILIVNMGTAVTYDVVTDKHEYLGGAIAPGLQMRFRALNAFTEKLPFVSLLKNNLLVGKTTTASIRSGVINGLASEIEGMIPKFKSQFKSSSVVILTGGDAPLFANQMKSVNFALPDLTLIGLNRVMEYNKPAM